MSMSAMEEQSEEQMGVLLAVRRHIFERQMLSLFGFFLLVVRF